MSRHTITLPRIGQISFLNALPIVLPIQHKQVPLEAKVCFGEPAQLNAALGTGNLDVSAISSFYYLQNNTLHLLAGASIACRKEVGSVLLFSKVEPSKLAGATITVPLSSATSVALLKILLAELYGVEAQFMRSAEHFFAGDDVQAVCVFGDRALEVDHEWSKHYLRFDLGAWWQELTSLPMVFAVWAAGKVWAQKNLEAVEHISESLKAAARLGLGKMFPEVLAYAHKRSNLPMERLTNYYLQQLNFDMSANHLAGLELFQKLCCKHNLLPA